VPCECGGWKGQDSRRCAACVRRKP
jgi:hypothetical protein